MSKAVDTQIAIGVVEALNGHEFSLEFTAVRKYVPVYELKDMNVLHVTVVAAELDAQGSSRTLDQEDHVVHVAVQQRFNAEPEADFTESVDTLRKLIQEISDFVRNLTVALDPGGQRARRIRTENKPTYDPKHLRELGQFTSVLAFTFRVTR